MSRGPRGQVFVRGVEVPRLGGGRSQILTGLIHPRALFSGARTVCGCPWSLALGDQGIDKLTQATPSLDVYSTTHMIRILGTTFAGLLGLAFGSFLNVCLTRWPQGESIVHPRSHCRNCDHALSWWENIPLLSWLVLRGRCRNCRTWIGWRYPLVELAVGALWAATVWNSPDPHGFPINSAKSATGSVDWALAEMIAGMILSWLLVALAVFDAENLWLPNLLMFPGIILGALANLEIILRHSWRFEIIWDCCSVLSFDRDGFFFACSFWFIGVILAALLILIIRWLYKLIRHREGIGLGDAKLMALLAAWLGLPGALLAFGIGVVLGALVAVVLLMVPSANPDTSEWSLRKLPLGTFLCIGGIISALWGQPIIAAYLHSAGL
jgi:leader peptidase (prepilin peptidase)/N-methyltransferase